MYVLNLTEEATMQLRCSTVKTYAVNVMLVSLPSGNYSDYRRMARSRGKPVLDSGNYRHGFSVTQRKKIGPGVYVIVVSTYKRKQEGSFSVKVASSVKAQLDTVP